MQDISQHPGREQTLHAIGDPSGDWTSNNLEHNYYQKNLPPHSANPPCQGQTTTGTYLAQLSCTTSEQTVTSTTQLTSEIKPSQENHLNSKCMMPTGKHNANIVLVTAPGSSIQIFVPVNNMSLQETYNGPNISHSAPRPGAEAFNYYNAVCIQQQTTSVPAGPNSCQHYPTKTINNRSLNEHTNASNHFPQDPSTKRMTLPLDSRYRPKMTNAPNGRISPLGGPVHHKLTANLQALSTCKQNIQQNNATKKAVAVVTPLSPIEMASVNLLNKSAYALDARSVPVHHVPNFTHPLEVNANATVRELNDPTSKHERPKSTEPKLNGHVVKSPVCLLESTNKRNHASLPKLNSAATDQNKSVEIPKEASQMMHKDNRVVTDKEMNTGVADKNSTVPVIEWPLDKLHTLTNILQQIEDGHQKKLNKTDAGREILSLYWNGDFDKFCSKAQTGILENIMEEVYNYCQKKDAVILKQIKNEARNQVLKDFHVLKHNEVPPKIEYKSSWLNLNEKVDDIDKECGISWYFRCLHLGSQERVKQDLQHSSDNEGLHEHLPVFSNEQFLPVTDHSPSQNIATQTNMEMAYSISVENASMDKTSISAAVHCLEQDLQEVNSASQEIMLSHSNPSQDTISRDEEISVESFDEMTNNSEHKIQSMLADTSYKLPITGNDRCMMGIVSKMPAEEQMSSDSRSVYDNLPDSFYEKSRADTNCSPKLQDVVTEETSCQPNASNPLKAISHLVKTLDDKVVSQRRSSTGTSGRARLYGGRAVQVKELTRKSNGTNSLSMKANVKNSAHATQSAVQEGNGHQGAKAVNKVRVEEPTNLTKLLMQSDFTNALKISPTVAEQRAQIQNESNEKLTDNDCANKTIEKSSITERDQCAVETEPAEPQIPFEHVKVCKNVPGFELLQEERFMSSFEKEFKNSARVAQSTSLELEKPLEYDLLERMHDSEVVRLDGAVCKGTAESTCKYNLRPPILDPVEFVTSPQMQNKSNKPFLNEDVICETVIEPCTEVALHASTEEREMDALASFKISVLPHEIAEQWFAGKMAEDKDFVTDTDVHASSKDQEDVEVLDHSDDQVEIKILDHCDDQIKMFYPEKNREDLKPIERHLSGAVDVKLESYCCFAKWFQSLSYGDGSLCMCPVKTELSAQKFKTKTHDTSVKMQTNEEKTDTLTNDDNSSECTKELSTSHTDMPADDAVGHIKTVKACPDFKGVFEAEKATSEQIKDKWPSKCVGDEYTETENPFPDVKKKSETVCLSLYGSSKRRDGLIRNKRYKDCCEEPPENLKITISSHQKNDRRLLKRKWEGSVENTDDLDMRRENMSAFLKSCDESETPQVHKATPMKVSEVTNKNALFSSTLTRKLPPHNAKKCLKKKQSLGTRQISMNNYIVRRKTVSSSHSPEPILKSKYELGNPALMPLQEGFGLEFKVLPSSFNFEDKTEPDSSQADTSSAKNEVSYPGDKIAKRRKTIHAPTQGTWSFSPLKPKHIQSTDVSSSCSLFQEFKKRFQERKKEMDFKTYLETN